MRWGSESISVELTILSLLQFDELPCIKVVKIYYCAKMLKFRLHKVKNVPKGILCM